MAHTHNTQRRFRQHDTTLALKQQEHRLDVLAHRSRIASWCIGPSYALRGTVGSVYMVTANGRRGDKPHTAAVKQSLIASSTCTHNKCIGILYGRIRKCMARHIVGLYSHSCQGLTDIGYLVVYNYFYHLG